MQEESDFLRGQMNALYDQIEALREELETLRASNRIKQANIEQLKAENESLKTELLCITHDRDALLAERDRMQNNIEGNEEHIKSLEEAFDKIEKYNWQLLAEREAMIKQAPIDEVEHIKNLDAQFNIFKSRVSYKLDNDSGIVEFAIDGKPTQSWALDDTSSADEVFEDYLKILRIGWIYSHPLPAQQIPEGYALEWHEVSLVVTGPDNGQGITYADETLYQFIKAMLSASQPKGE